MLWLIVSVAGQCESLRTQLENIYGPQNVLCDTVVEYGVVGTSFHITHVTGKCVFGGLQPGKIQTSLLSCRS